MRLIFFLTITCFISLMAHAHDGHFNSELIFIKNQGQWESKVQYKVDLLGGTMFAEKDRLTFLFSEKSPLHHEEKFTYFKPFYSENATSGKRRKNNISEKGPDFSTSEVIKHHAYQIIWRGANDNIVIRPAEKIETYYNYFFGNDPDMWKSKVPGFKKIRYHQIYNGIDCEIYSESTVLKSDYIIKPGADPSKIQIEYKGVEKLQLNKNGDLVIYTSVNTVTEHRPYAYQMIDGQRVRVECRYSLRGQMVSFLFPTGFDPTYELIIDPTLVFSTYSGSLSDNWGSSATFDSRGNMFVGGIALGPQYPVTIGAFQTTYDMTATNSCDVVVTKYTSDGSAQIYSTFIGGRSSEVLSSLRCTPEDELILLITTGSNNFPTTPTAFRRIFNGGNPIAFFGTTTISFNQGTDIAIVKLSEDGSRLVGSTLFGGNLNEGANNSPFLSSNYGDESRGDVAIDSEGNIYIVSNTRSSNLTGTTGKAQARIGGRLDGFVAKFTPDLSGLFWATYVGGTEDDACYGIAVDSRDQIFVTGGTSSGNFPGTQRGVFNAYRGGSADGFIIRMDKDGNNFNAGTFVGTTSYDQSYLIDLDRNDEVYIFGQTRGNYPVSPGVFSTPNGGQFIHKFNNDLNASRFSTVFGSTNNAIPRININPTALLVDVCENMYAVGWGGGPNSNIGTTTGMPVTPNAFKRTTDGADFYLINLSRNAQSLLYATYFGEDSNQSGDHVDGGISRFDKFGVVYQAVCASCRGTNGFPTTPNAFSRVNLSTNCNMAGVKFRFDLQAMLITETAAQPSRGCAPLEVDFRFVSTQPGTTFFWDFGDGNTSTERFPRHTYTSEGNYRVKLIIQNPNNCNPIDSAFLDVEVLDAITNITEREICQGDSVVINNQSFTATDRYILEFLTQGNCDSLVILDLTVHPTFNIDTTITFCEGTVLEFANEVFIDSGNFRFNFVTSQGCDSLINLNLIRLPKPNVTIEGNELFCNGDTIILRALSDATVFSWSNNETTDRINVTTGGLYEVTVTSDNGCTDRNSIEVITYPIPSVPVGEVMILDCVTDAVQLGLNPAPPFEYVWSGPGINTANARQPNPIVNQEGIYTLRITDEFGCTHIDSVEVRREFTFPFPSFQIIAPCQGIDDGAIIITRLNGGTEPLLFTINGTEYIQVNRRDFLNLRSGIYEVTIVDAEGCTSSATITVPEAPQIFLDLGPDVNLKYGASYQINPTIILPDGISIDSFFWNPTTYLSCTNCLDPIATPEDSILYVLTLIDNNGCIVTDSIYIRIFRPANIFVPNVFTPNKDGINDRITVFADASVKGILEFKIFDRWGELVHERYNFQPNDELLGWDGTFRGKEMNPAVFVYYVEAELWVDETTILTGDITLLR